MSPPNNAKLTRQTEAIPEAAAGSNGTRDISKDCTLWKSKIQELANKRSNEDSRAGELYFKVDGVKLEDLYDWSTSAVGQSISKGSNVRQVPKAKTGTLVDLNYKKIALFKYGTSVYAIDEKCPHLGGPLHLGDIETLADTNILCVVCPWHKWRVELDNGKVKLPQGRDKASVVYPVKQGADGSLWVGFNAMDRRFFEGDHEF